MKKTNNCAEKGATIIEVLLAAIIGLAVCVAGLYVLNAKVVFTENNRITKEAENAGEQALSALSAVASDLSVGGSFSDVNDNVLTLVGCTAQTCDYVLPPDLPGSSMGGASPAKGLPYGTPLPTGAVPLYFRRWRIEDENTDYRLRKITIAILKDERDNKPSLILSTTVKMP